MPTILTVSVDGQPKRKILALFAKRLGILLKLPKSDIQLSYKLFMNQLINLGIELALIC